MTGVDKLLAEALAHQLGGNLSSAEKIYDEILAQEPVNLDALNRLGIVCLDTGRIDAAIEHFNAALGASPDFNKARINLGNAYILQRKFTDAARLYEQALTADPSNAAALHGLGTSYLESGNYDEAMGALQMAITIAPDSVDTLNNIGLIHLKRGEYDLAIQRFNKSIALNPGHANAHANLGTVFKELRAYPDANECFMRALAIDPNHLESINNLGLISVEQMGPTGLGDAIAHYRRALKINPEFFPALYNLGIALHERGGDLEATVDCYRKCLELRPHDQGALGMALATYARACDWESARTVLHVIEDRFKRDPDFSVFPFPLLAASDSAAFHLEAARRHAKTSIVVPLVQRSSRAKSTSEQIKVAYLSHDFRHHATSILMAELFELHDRNRFEVIGISYGRDDGSEMRRRVSSAFDRFIDVQKLSDAEVASQLAELEVDIAVDLKGHTQFGRPAILASRPCPIQVNYLGYPGTMGADFIDYIVGDNIVTPPEHQQFYSEKIAALPDCYQVNDSKRRISPQTPGRGECGLPPHGFVFCCFNNSYKITADVFEVWMRLLADVEGSVLWLLDDNRSACANLTHAAAAKGIDPARLVFAPRVTSDQHLARHRLADLFLDTFPYNAHTTASDALWTGLPVVTRTGEGFASRVCASALQAVGLPELVTSNLQAYEELALKLACDRHLLQQTRARLAENIQTSALFDSRRFCRDIEAAFENMWTIYQSGGPPRSFAV